MKKHFGRLLLFISALLAVGACRKEKQEPVADLPEPWDIKHYLGFGVGSWWTFLNPQGDTLRLEVTRWERRSTFRGAELNGPFIEYSTYCQLIDQRQEDYSIGLYCDLANNYEAKGGPDVGLIDRYRFFTSTVNRKGPAASLTQLIDSSGTYTFPSSESADSVRYYRKFSSAYSGPEPYDQFWFAPGIGPVKFQFYGREEWRLARYNAVPADFTKTTP